MPAGVLGFETAVVCGPTGCDSTGAPPGVVATSTRYAAAPLTAPHDSTTADPDTWAFTTGAAGATHVAALTTSCTSFDGALALTGLIVTKLDGTAKGGAIAAIAREHPVPIRFIGIGEKPDDLRPFVAADFVDALFE